MPDKNEKEELLFLLGAGASWDAGLPLATDLTERIMSDIQQNHPVLLPLMRFVHGGICFGRGCAGQVPNTPVNIEEFLMACHDLARRGSSTLYPFVASWHEKLTDFSRLPREYAEQGYASVFEFIINHSKGRLREWLTLKDTSKAKYFRDLCDFVRAGYRVRVFTLNYDDCVEQAFADALGEINKKWTTGFGENGWEPRLLDKRRLSAFVYKLHGSLDWVDDEALGICSVKWPAAQRAEEIPEDYDSLLIFATAAKVVPRDPYLSLLVKFRKELERCNCVVILGYSFGDEHINTVLLDALRRRPRLQCIIANKKAQAADYLPAALREEIANDRFHNIGDRKDGEIVGVRAVLEDNMLLQKVKQVSERTEEDKPF